MFSRPLPLWIPVGGFVLTLSAGATNAVGFLSISHSGLSHMSGNLSILGIHLANGHFATAVQTLLLIVSFFLGAVVSGIIIRQSTLQLGRRYTGALLLESALLVGAWLYLRRGDWTGDFLAAAACGLQNAMATSYSGAVIRTTHMTGILTDLGLAAGHWARGHAVDWRRMRLHGILLSGFLIGGIGGAAGFLWIDFAMLLFPAGIAAAAGLGHRWVRHHEASPR